MLAIVGAVLVTMLAMTAQAAEEPPQKKVPSEKTEAGFPPAENAANGKPLPSAEGPETVARPRTSNADLDQLLLRDLLPDLPLKSKSSTENDSDKELKTSEPRSRIPLADELDETVEAMREVSRRLEQRNLSDETEQLQTGIVTNIDALIEKLKNLPPPSSSSSSNQDQSDQNSQQDQQNGRQQRPQQKPQESPHKQQGAESSAGSAPQPQTGKSGESSEQNLREARERAAALARRRALVDEVWGHLPPAMRERLLNVGSEKLLPQYEDLIRRYYESLADPDKAGVRR